MALGVGLLLVAGCTRTYYHDFADRNTYGILRERLFDWRWRLPPRPVEADPKSRMADFANSNYEPIPPDEAAARDFQISNRFPFEYHGWKKRGMAPVEYLDWQRNIPTESDGKVLLSRDSVMRLAITNSRDYQTNYENLYLAALALTQAPFQFMVQGFSNSGWLGQIQGFGKTQDDQLQLSTLNGFQLQLMTGAQLMASLANSLVFNQQYQAEYKGGFKSVIELQQVAFQYQSNQVALLAAEATLQKQLDAFKVQLGLPPETEVRLDDTILQQFQLNDPKLDTMRTENDARHLTLLQSEQFPRSDLTAAARLLQTCSRSRSYLWLMQSRRSATWSTSSSGRGFPRSSRPRPGFASS